MKIIEERPVTIYRYDGQYGTSYSIGLSKKKQDGTYEKGFIPVKFKKDVELENKTQIYITNGWLSFNLKDKHTYPFIFINEFKTLDEAIKPSKETLKEKEDNTHLYEEFGNEIELTNEDLPF